MTKAHRCVIALGANLADRVAALRGAVRALEREPGVEVRTVSAIFETEPVGGPEQPAYLNAVVIVDAAMEPSELLAVCQRIEAEWHRTREVRWGPRTLDLDIIDVAGVTSADPRLTLPHPRAHERAFVLIPWRDADPDAELTGVGRIDALAIDESGVYLTDSLLVDA